jgi:hypothetical protein
MSGPWPPATPFNYTQWTQWFPTFVNVSEPFATACFFRASQSCQNNCASPVVIRNGGDTTQLQYFLNLLTCHIAWLNAPQINGQPNTSGGGTPPASLVGRISSATEGSVTVAAEMPDQPQGAAWYQQTQWGAEYWANSAQYRQGPYVPGRPQPPRWYGASGYRVGWPAGWGRGGFRRSW